jgi:glycosyltransferase involved in cell wall biosynthesis
VVAGDIPAVRSLIRPGVDGELVPVGLAQPLADALLSLLDDPDRRSAYAAEGRRRAESEFAWDCVVDAWDEFLRATLARSRAGATPAVLTGRT